MSLQPKTPTLPTSGMRHISHGYENPYEEVFYEAPKRVRRAVPPSMRGRPTAPTSSESTVSAPPPPSPPTPTSATLPQAASDDKDPLAAESGTSTTELASAETTAATATATEGTSDSAAAADTGAASGPGAIPAAAEADTELDAPMSTPGLTRVDTDLSFGFALATPTTSRDASPERKADTDSPAPLLVIREKLPMRRSAIKYRGEEPEFQPRQLGIAEYSGQIPYAPFFCTIVWAGMHSIRDSVAYEAQRRVLVQRDIDDEAAERYAAYLRERAKRPLRLFQDFLKGIIGRAWFRMRRK